MDLERLADIVEIEQLLARYASGDHSMRIGYYTDTYRRTPEGWRLSTRAMTFLRRSGARDSGRPHEPGRPLPGEPNA